MAARSALRQESTTCEALLQKLRKGQNELKSSLKKVHRGGRKPIDEEKKRRGTKERGTLPKSAFERPLNRVDDFPRKRARLLQLSPDHMSSIHVGGPHPETSKAHIRRLSSTPKQTETLVSSRPVPPSLDHSLEEAILTKKGREEDKSKRKQKLSSSMKSQGSYSAPLPSPKMSRIVVDTSRRLSPPGSIKKQKNVTEGISPSLARTGRSKKRGLSVSFVQVGDENDEDVSLKKKKGSSRTVPDQSVTNKDLGASLIESLNSSRYGALDRTLSQTRKQHLFPRKYAGDDPRLGYDWIAGLLDASEAYLSEKDDEYFEDVKEFRRVNHAECFRPVEVLLPGSSLKKEDTPIPDSVGGRSKENQPGCESEGCCTTCVSSYVINDRLFPMLVHPTSGADSLGLDVCCPVCQGKHSREKSPTRYVRVSVPRSTLQMTSKVRPHRRRSFDPTDSMGLAEHCLAGWETAQPSIIPPQSQVDLKSSINNQTSHRVARELLNTSHYVEYSLRSRTSSRK